MGRQTQSNLNKFDLLTYFEFINRPKVVLVLLMMQAGATGVITALMYLNDNVFTAWIMLVFFISAVILIGFHFSGHQKIALAGLLLVFPLIMTLLMAQGQGLHDIGMLGLVIYIVFSSLLLGKRFLPVSLILCLASVVFLYLSENAQLFPWKKEVLLPSDFIDLIIIVILLTIAASVFWIVMDIIEKTIVRVAASERKVKEAYDLTLEGWAKALEMRDKETEGHSRRVTELTLQMGRILSFSEDDLFHLRRGALLHDIGKMAIPDSILNKPGKLTEEELAVIRCHPIYAYEMLKDIEFLERAMVIPRNHHEQWDGKGYPDKLAGEDIPLPARIFAVVDNWDALLSERPYRPAWTREKVIDYIREEAGKKFDPAVVEAFLSIVISADEK